MKERTFEELGTHMVGNIELKKHVYVTDPCYDTMMTWCQKLLDNVAPGTYRCFVVVSDEGNCGHRVAELHVILNKVFDKYGELSEIPYDPEPLNCYIDIDSGQCGIFDANYYEEHQPDDDYGNKNSWYRRVCDLTNNAGIIDGLGVVCASGYGDGSYDLWVAKDDDGNVVAMKVVFINDEEDDSDEN